jgi:small basic protein (TIGR04137 family)
MSLDRSLKTSGGLSKHRNVLTRAERIAKLGERSKFDWAKNSPLGLVKVGNRKIKATKSTDKKEGDAAAAPAPGAAAPAAKAAAPAAGAKAAAPAAKKK